jgi:hypothetical protein
MTSVPSDFFQPIFSWADEGEDEWNESCKKTLAENTKNHKEEQRKKQLEEVKRRTTQERSLLAVTAELYKDIKSFDPRIVGLVLCQLARQRTITIYREGKEHRELVSSELQLHILNVLHKQLLYII